MKAILAAFAFSFLGGVTWAGEGQVPPISCQFQVEGDPSLSAIQLFQAPETGHWYAKYQLFAGGSLVSGESQDVAVDWASPEQVQEAPEAWQSVARLAGVAPESLDRVQSFGIQTWNGDGNGVDLLQLFDKEGRNLGGIVRVGWGFVPCNSGSASKLTFLPFQ